MKFAAIDLFSGAGGLSLGLQTALFDVRMALDKDPHAVATYRRNFGHPILDEDVRNISGAFLLEKAGLEPGTCALVAGGPPCQGFSIQRRGDAMDERNDLVLEYLRLVLEIRPPFFLMENVEGLMGSRGKAYLNKIKSTPGYRCHIAVLDAADYGVPQHRRRVFIVGERMDVKDQCFFKFPTPTHNEETWRSVGDAICGLPAPPQDYTEHPLYPHHKRTKISPINELRISHVPQGGGWEHIPPELQLSCHRPGADRIGHRYVYGRLAWNEPSGTITGRFDSFTRGKFAHPLENRNITLREGARIQTFPDTFTFTGGQEDIARQIGNAVPPELAKMIGTSIRDALVRKLAGTSLQEPGTLEQARLFQ